MSTPDPHPTPAPSTASGAGLSDMQSILQRSNWRVDDSVQELRERLDSIHCVASASTTDAAGGWVDVTDAELLAELKELADDREDIIVLSWDDEAALSACNAIARRRYPEGQAPSGAGLGRGVWKTTTIRKGEPDLVQWRAWSKVRGEVGMFSTEAAAWAALAASTSPQEGGEAADLERDLRGYHRIWGRPPEATLTSWADRVAALAQPPADAALRLQQMTLERDFAQAALANVSRPDAALRSACKPIVAMLRKSICDLQDRRMAVENLEALEAALAPPQSTPSAIRAEGAGDE